MNMILYYAAKRYPQCYVKNFEMANTKAGKNGPPLGELPPDFVSYDGTNDVKWNKNYAELVKVCSIADILELFCLISCISLRIPNAFQCNKQTVQGNKW